MQIRRADARQGSHQRRRVVGPQGAAGRGPVQKSKFYGAFALNLHVDLHAIDATPARWRGGVGSSPLGGTSAATSYIAFMVWSLILLVVRVYIAGLVHKFFNALQSVGDDRAKELGEHSNYDQKCVVVP